MLGVEHFGLTKVWLGLKIGYDLPRNRVTHDITKIAKYARLAQKMVAWVVDAPFPWP